AAIRPPALARHRGLERGNRGRQRIEVQQLPGAVEAQRLPAAEQLDRFEHAPALLAAGQAASTQPDRSRIHPPRVAAPAPPAAQLANGGVTDVASVHPSLVGPPDRGRKFSATLRAVPTTRALIHAPWSASKVSTGLRCPRLFHFKYVDKLAEPEVMPETRIGKAVHKAIELVMQGTPLAEAMTTVRAGLPSEIEQMRFDQLGHGIPAFTSRIGQFRRRRRVARQLVEYSLAIREDLSTTQFYAGDAYYRGVLDLGYIFDDDTLALVDHKTGARIPGTSIADPP